MSRTADVLRERRYARLKLIPWWDQDRLASARVMVVGAGAIGNEVIKNLALLGIGRIIVVDIDSIEDTNLSRSVLFRAADVGQAKAEVAARRALEINPDIRIATSTASIVDGIGLGVFRRMDVVIGALDNREARLAVNRQCWLAGVPWIDTGIHTIDGQVRTFFPGQPPCYECTLTDDDYAIMQKRRSCQLMTPDVPFPATPTTPTIGSIIGGIAVQEAVKLLHRDHGAHVEGGTGFLYHGGPNFATKVKYTEKPECASHMTLPEIIELPVRSDQATLKDLYKTARKHLGRKALVEFSREIVHEAQCLECGERRELFIPQSALTPETGVHCGQVMDLSLIHSISGGEPFLGKTLAELGLPAFDILSARRGLDAFVAFEISGDRDTVLDGILREAE